MLSSTIPSSQKSASSYALASICVLIWGTTFVSTKSLTNASLSPTLIFFVRFAIALLLLLPTAWRHARLLPWRDELLSIIAGISGGSIYFIAENTAIKLTYASNVALIIATTPLMTIALVSTYRHTLPNLRMLIGSLIALAGVAMVVITSGNNEVPTHSISLAGELLALAAALLWAIYCIVVKRLANRYSSSTITLKTFFYGLITSLPFLLTDGSLEVSADSFTPAVIANLLYLGVGASLACYLMWNVVVARIGAEKASNYVYCVPVIGVIASILLLGEPMTAYIIIGVALLIIGLRIAR